MTTERNATCSSRQARVTPARAACPPTRRSAARCCIIGSVTSWRSPRPSDRAHSRCSRSTTSRTALTRRCWAAPLMMKRSEPGPRFGDDDDEPLDPEGELRLAREALARRACGAFPAARALPVVVVLALGVWLASERYPLRQTHPGQGLRGEPEAARRGGGRGHHNLRPEFQRRPGVLCVRAQSR